MIMNRIKGSKKSLVDIIATTKTCIWNRKVVGTHIEKFKDVIASKYGRNFDSYSDLHVWTVQNFQQFWEEILKYFDVIYSGTYQEVCTKNGQGLTDVQWFRGAKINYAENLLRYRDERTAMICVDREGIEEKITYAQLYDQSKMYAAAFKKLGLQQGDRVACYMENRKEAVFAMLGAVSLGAVWGGPLPFAGIQLASSIIRTMKPKFLITMDSTYDDGTCNMLKHVPTIINGMDSLSKVIVVPRKGKSVPSYILEMEKSCSLKEFLEHGKDPDGTYPDMTFLQLSFNHPIIINFTSGTTGSPKGIIHSAASLLTLLQNIGLHTDCNREDVYLAQYPVGWIVWDFFTSALSLGVSLILYNGDQLFYNEYHFWDLLSKYKITYVFETTVFCDKMEKNGLVPGPHCNLQHLKMITLGGSPVKPENVSFLLQHIKNDNIFIGTLYSSTELFTFASGFDFNTAAYSCEMQAPALGLDFKCFNKQGNSVIGQRGDAVIPSPYPSLPIGIWDDENDAMLNELYFSKHKEVWCQNDECFINPETNGIIIIGRSDDVMVPGGTRFSANDIYEVIHTIEELSDYLCFGQNCATGDARCVLFIKLKLEFSFTPELVKKIQKKIATDLSADYVPGVILETADIPYSLVNKRMERLVKKIVETNEISRVSNVRNPECLTNFLDIPELQDVPEFQNGNM